jgi:uncharacterized protein (TIGR02231 family)
MKVIKNFIISFLIIFTVSTIKSETKNDFEIFHPQIHEVIVYPDRAMIQRSQIVDLKTGKHILRFESASLNLDTNSLRGYSADKDLVVNGISSHLEPKPQSSSKEYNALESKLQELELKKDLELKRIDSINHDLSSVENYSKYLSFSISEDSSQEKSNGENQFWMDAFQFLSKRKNIDRSKNQDSEITLENINQEIKTIEDQLTKIKSLNNRTFRVVELNVQALKEKKFDIGFFYVIYGASWNVSYSAQLESDGTIKIDYFSNINQETGEDWKNVSLKLSTSSPSRGTSRPKVKSMFVFGRKAITTQEYVQSETAVLDGEISNSLQEPVPVAESPTSELTELETQGGSLLFVIPERATIPSIQKSHKVTIAQITEKSNDLRYRIVGSLQSSSHLSVQLTNKKNYPFLAGTIDSFRGNNFTGKSNMDYTPPGQKLLIGFGVDRTVDFLRNVKTFKDNSSTLNSHLQFHTLVDLEVQNRSDETRNISVYERIPVSELEEIQVDIINETSQGFKMEQPGILKWDITLNPREKKKINLHFKVKTPENFPGTVYGE